jgi:hypothetical protein
MTAGNAEEVRWWIEEREKIRKLNEAGAPRPWTTDPILDRYRFCNVRREDDRVTRWLKKHWRDPYHDHPNLTVAMLLARMLNWPPTLEWLGFPEEWNPDLILKRLRTMPPTGKTWGSAYVITTCGRPMDKALYVVQSVCNAAKLRGMQPIPGDTLESFWNRLRGIPGLGAGFIAAQVVADLKNTRGNPLYEADDWETWAVQGPGSARGLNRYFNQPVEQRWRDADWKAGLDVMIMEVQPLVKKTVGNIHAQDWQNVMCEYDKWKRAKDGTGKPKRTYSPEVAFQI